MYEDDEENENTSSTLKDLRKQRDQFKKDLETLQKQFAEVQKASKSRSLADALTSKGVKPGIAKYALADGVEDEAGLDAWLVENGDLFGVTKAAPEPEVDDEDQAAMQGVQSNTGGGNATASRTQAQIDLLDKATTTEEWTAAVNAMNGKTDGFI